MRRRYLKLQTYPGHGTPFPQRQPVQRCVERRRRAILTVGEAPQSPNTPSPMRAPPRRCAEIYFSVGAICPGKSVFDTHARNFQFFSAHRDIT